MLRSASASQQALEEQRGQAGIGKQRRPGTAVRMAASPEW